MEKELRKKLNILGVGGLAVIAFGIWAILKIIVFAISTPDGFSVALGLDTANINGPQERTLYILTFIVVILIDLGLRCLIGFSARAESKGKKKSIFYLIVAGFLLLFSALSIIIAFQRLFTSSVFDSIVTILVELTSLLALLEVIISASASRRLRKALKTEQNG